jgi:pimeloyl-ACP methyl ester carboxylesterase
MVLATALLLTAMTSGIEPDTVRLPASGSDEPALLLRRAPGNGPAVLYVHGATFPSASSIFYRIAGTSWGDDLAARGFDVWAFDFAGYGGSDRPAAMAALAGAPVGRADDAARQIERVVRHVTASRGGGRVMLLAHSWGTLPAIRFAGAHPELVERLVLFGPVAQRDGKAAATTEAPALQVSAEDQWRSFQAGLPAGEASPIAPAIFEDWVRDYLASDKTAADRRPASVRVPSGPQADFNDAWAGRLPVDPSRVRAPTLIVRGAWDPITQDRDAAWLVAALRNVPGGARDAVLPRGAHRMHLEINRQALFDVVAGFLAEP